MQIKVVKADGSVEQYLHTKVLGTINNAMVLCGRPNLQAAEQLAEAVTYFVYNRDGGGKVSSSEIFSMVLVVLADTSYDDAAEFLGEYQQKRRLKRRRIEVVDDVFAGLGGNGHPAGGQWDKSVIVRDLVEKQSLSRQLARTVASLVEEKVLNMGMSRVSHGLIEQLVRADTAVVLAAQQQLALAERTEPVEQEQVYADRDVRVRQQQEGLCAVEL